MTEWVPVWPACVGIAGDPRSRYGTFQKYLDQIASTREISKISEPKRSQTRGGHVVEGRLLLPLSRSPCGPNFIVIPFSLLLHQPLLIGMFSKTKFQCAMLTPLTESLDCSDHYD